MTKQSKILIPLCFLVISFFSQLSHAGASRLEDDYLIVPRIDVEGYGALELVFRLAFDNDFVLILEQVNEASLNTDNSGVFDPRLLTIDIDEILLESGDSYFVKIGLISQFPFTTFGFREVVQLSSGNQGGTGDETNDDGTADGEDGGSDESGDASEGEGDANEGEDGGDADGSESEGDGTDADGSETNEDGDAAEDGTNEGESTEGGSGDDDADIPNSLLADTDLNGGDRLQSPNDAFRLYLQGDGNLVLRDNETGESLWSSGTQGTGAMRLRLQGDGNLVLRTAGGSAVWSTSTEGSGSNRLQLNNDGMLALYAGDAVVWSVNAEGDDVDPDDSSNSEDDSSETNRLLPDVNFLSGERLQSDNGEYRLYFQGDGNVVLRDVETGSSLWSSGTNGTGAVRMRLQGDGNLVIRSEDGSSVWSSKTAGIEADLLRLNNDGSLAIYAGDDVVWVVNGEGTDGGDNASEDNTGDDSSGDNDNDNDNGDDSSSAGDNSAHGSSLMQLEQNLYSDERLESSNGAFRLYFQGDGNLVLRDVATGSALWSTGTQGTGAVRMRLQGDGNLVIRSEDGESVWSSKTAGSGADSLRLNDDGSLGLYAGNTAVWVVNGSGDQAGNDDDDNAGGSGGDNGGGSTNDNDGVSSSTAMFTTPSAALFTLNDSRQRVFPKPIDTGYSGNGHTVSWDGRVFVRTRSAGWFANTFRPERIGVNGDGTPNFREGAFGSSVELELEDENPNVHHNWLAMVPDPDVTTENPYASDANGNARLDGSYRTYKALIYHTSRRGDNSRQMGQRKATFIVRDANTRDAQISTAEFTSDFERLVLEGGSDFNCIEPSATMDARLVVCQGHPDNNGRIDNLVYSWTEQPGSATGWKHPKSLANMYHDDRNTDVDGVAFSVRYPLAGQPILDATGAVFARGQLIKGAYPWVSRDGSEVFYQASRDGVSARRTGTSVIGRWTGGIVRHIDGPINPNRHQDTRLFLSSPGAFTTMWTPFKDVADLPLPYSVRGPSFPIFGSNNHDYMEVGFDDFLDGNYVMYLGMNEQLNRDGNFQVNATNDTSGHFNNGALIGAKFPLEYNNRDELAGRFGQAIYFPAGAYLDIDRNAGWDSLVDGVTVDFFLHKLETGSGRIQLFEMRDGIEIYLDNATTLMARIEDSTGNSVSLSGPAIPNQSWVHLALSYSPFSQEMALYVDGSKVASTEVSDFGQLRTSGSVRVGPVNSEALLQLDEFKVSNVARRAYEIGHNAYARSNSAPSQILSNEIPAHFAALARHSTSIDRFSFDAAALGEDLFSDDILSKQRSTSCATCHKPDLFFTDGRDIAMGNEPTDAGTRNTPTLVNRLFSSLQGWSGGADSLDTQGLIPIAAEHEMNLPIVEAVERLLNDGDYSARFQQVYGEPVNGANLAAALASFQALQFSPRSVVDDFRAGDVDALSDAQRRGLVLFEGKARCSGCHWGSNYTDESFRNTGLTQDSDSGRGEITGRDRDHRLFKVPTLRSILFTAPYMHDGSVATLREVVELYNEGAVNGQAADTDIRPLELNDQEIDDIVEFLSAL